MSSLENITSEAIQCLAFAESYSKKSGMFFLNNTHTTNTKIHKFSCFFFTEPTTPVPTLWIGTSLGSVLTVPLQPPDVENRTTQPYIVSICGGPMFRLKGSIIAMSFLDCNGALIPYTFEAWRDENKERKDR